MSETSGFCTSKSVLTRVVILGLLCLCLSACTLAPSATPLAAGPDVSAGAGNGGSSGFSLDDYGDDDFYEPPVEDPLQDWNRFWFGVNDRIYQDILIPMQEGQTEPSPLRRGLGNFSHNLNSPVRFANALLQGEFAQAGVEMGRFFINTVMGLGFFDVATANNPPLFPYYPETLNFGATLAKWGVPPGPYLILPLGGPKTTRQVLGMAGDLVLDPFIYFGPWYTRIGSLVLMQLDSQDTDLLSGYKALTQIAIDPYISVRSAYISGQAEIEAHLREVWND